MGTQVDEKFWATSLSQMCILRPAGVWDTGKGPLSSVANLCLCTSFSWEAHLVHRCPHFKQAFLFHPAFPCKFC